MPPPPPRITEVAFTKNEGRFLLEWVAYHRLIGVSDILVYTNDCEDESPALLDRLEEMGLVTHVPNPLAPGELPQNKALNRAKLHPLVTAADYVLQIDVDEFLCIKTGAGMMQDLIGTAPEADVICIQMRFFGDSGLERLDDGPVIAQLTRSSAPGHHLNRIVKSLARNSELFSKVTSNHMPSFTPTPGREPRVFNGDGVEVPPDTYGHERFSKMPEGYRGARNAQLNHYAVRTFPDYRAKKYRGTPAGNDFKLTLGYWTQRNRNEVVDTAVHRHLASTMELMQSWLRDPVLAACNRRCFEAYDEILIKSEGLLARPS